MRSQAFRYVLCFSLLEILLLVLLVWNMHAGSVEFAPGEVVGTLLWRGLGLPTAPLAAPRAAEAAEVPATPATSSRLRRRATTATSPRAGAAPGAGRARLAIADSDLDGVGTGA